MEYVPFATHSIDYRSRIVEKCHEAEIHMQLLMTMEERQPRVVRNEIKIELLKTSQHYHILDDACGWPAADTCQFEAVPV